MSEKLFSYGTLQIENVQLETFGRKPHAHPGILPGYKIRDLLIKDLTAVNVSGKTLHPMACFTGNPNDEVPGIIFDITLEELDKADKYEVNDYKRIQCILKSGKQVWVYVQRGLNVDTHYLRKGEVALEIFQDSHTLMLCEKAKDPRIWEYHRVALYRPDIFKSMAIEKAKKAITDKTRYMFVIYYQNKIVGSTSYYNVDLKHLTMCIGYSWLHPDYWGKGINLIVKKLLLSYAFEQLAFRRVAFCIDSENLRSRGAIEKLKIPFEGILRNHQMRPDGSSRDSAIYAITDELWTPNS